MAKLEDITTEASIKGILSEGLVTVINVKWIGTVAIELTYKDASGNLGSELVYRDREPSLEILTAGTPWSFDGDGALFRLVSEARRIHLAYLFDPLLAVHTSLVEPLPHQLTAVYEQMLPRQPLRFLLADDPGAGKTIMTGLLIKELIVRGDLQRCLIVCPGNLAEQWQDEMDRRFHLPFDIMTNDALNAARTGNWFSENPLAICRLDKLSRNPDVQEKLQSTDWDLIVCDEAHKMSASYYGNEVKYTKRYQLGQKLSTLTRHFLLLTATPHNGKEADFQLFMALLDGDRFEGKFRDGVHASDTSDLMRRMVKEQLLKFDGTPLFPERRAYTKNYKLSPLESDLYQRVTDYVRQEFNRADMLENNGRKGTVGFALTILQRRLASSPEAIYQSLKRRKERLLKRLREEELSHPSAGAATGLSTTLPEYSSDDFDDLDDAPEAELEQMEESLVDQATAARTVAELKTEINMLQTLAEAALHVRQSKTDCKWDELSRLLQNDSEMFDAQGHRRKLVIFTEHRDTLNYLVDCISSVIGRPEAVVAIHGGVGREDRRKIQEAFTQDKEVEILIATDAAGEGINLQRAHLMVNYDLPWNFNRLEQRFGRIHRIGQTEVCHLWNLVAAETREGEVFHRLLEKLNEARSALGGRVYDVLGQVTFGDRPLRELLLDAVRYGDLPEVRARLFQAVDNAVNRAHLTSLVEERALAHDSMDASRVRRIREDMQRAEARRLQPHFIASFFREAFTLLGGSIHQREPDRYEIKNVPAAIRNRDRQIGRADPVLARYERITFHKELINIPGKPPAEFVCPGHPLLDATIDLISERHRDLLKRGTVLINDTDPNTEIYTLVLLEHSIQDAGIDNAGKRRIISRRMQFVALTQNNTARAAGTAPYLDCRPATLEELAAIKSQLDNYLHSNSLPRPDIESRAAQYAAMHLVPDHLAEILNRKTNWVNKTISAVRDRLTKEINYWDHRAADLHEQEQSGKVNAKLNSALARQRADGLTLRMNNRLAELQQELKISPLPPVVIGGALVVPAGLLQQLPGTTTPPQFARNTVESERRAMDAVMQAERDLGFTPRDVSADKIGYDIESTSDSAGQLRFIEVKGRAAGAQTVTITKNEILTALNKPDSFILAIVELNENTANVRYLRQPFQKEPDFGVTSVNYNFAELLAKSLPPA